MADNKLTSKALKSDDLRNINIHVLPGLIELKSMFGKYKITDMYANGDAILRSFEGKDANGDDIDVHYFACELTPVADEDTSVFTESETPSERKIFNEQAYPKAFAILKTVFDECNGNLDEMLKIFAKSKYHLDIEKTIVPCPEYYTMRKKDGKWVVSIGRDGIPFSTRTDVTVLRLRNEKGKGEARTIGSHYRSEISTLNKRGSFASSVNLKNWYTEQIALMKGGEVSTTDESTDEEIDE